MIYFYMSIGGKDDWGFREGHGGNGDGKILITLWMSVGFGIGRRGRGWRGGSLYI